MRPIKCRVWDKLNEKFIFALIDNIGNFYQQSGISFGSTNSESLVFQQFTGLLDKNGKEIYEGDIIGFEKVNNNKEIIFKFGAFCAKGIGREFDWEKDYGMPGNLDGIGNPWIAKGNIFENSELLK